MNQPHKQTAHVPNKPIINPEALYSYVSIEFDNYTRLLNTIEDELAKPIDELNMIVSCSQIIEGIDQHVDQIIIGKFYKIKDFLFNAKKAINNYERRLSVYFLHNENNKIVFYTRVDEINKLIKDKEVFVDYQIDKAVKFLKKYEETFGLTDC